MNLYIRGTMVEVIAKLKELQELEEKKLRSKHR